VSETGESTASIRARGDQTNWPHVESALRDGAELQRPMGLRDYYTRGLADRDPRNGRGITAAMVRRLEADGVIARVGVDTYKLARGAS
jgi:hypothetical protein